MDSWILFWTHIIVLTSTGSEILGQSAGDVRLVDGSSSLEGRLEVYYNNSWGTICNQGWDTTDSDVVCRQLGFQVSLGSPSFGPGMSTQRVWLTNVQCEAIAQHLNECITPGQWGQTSTCPHSMDVGVRCSGLNVGIAPNYHGCYRFEDVSLNARTISFASNTIEDCLESCSRDSMFAGLRGTTCTCGDEINPSAQPVDDVMCRMPCPGNAAQLCGEDEANMELSSIYSVSVGDGYLSSPWFPGNYVLPSTDTSQPVNLISSAAVTTQSGMLLVRILAMDLAPMDTLSVEVGDITVDATTPGDVTLSGLSAMVTLTATLMRAANSPGASGFLIMYGDVPSASPTTMAPPPQTTNPTPLGSPPPTPQQTPDTPPPTPASPGMVTSSLPVVVTGTQPPATPVATDPVTNAAPVITTPASTCPHPVVERGDILDQNTGPYQIGETVMLDCDDGLSPVENTTLECQSGGIWSPLPTCTSPLTGLAVWMIVVIAVVIALILVILIVIFLICAVAFGKKEKRREDEEVLAITHMASPADNEYSTRPPLIPINEASASGLVPQGTNISTASTIPDPPPPPPPAPQSNDAVQQTEPIILPPPSQPAPDPPSPTETYPPRDYPGAGNRDSVISNGTAQSNGHVNNLGNEERQAVDELINAVKDYDDSPSVGMYGSVPPRHLRSGSSLSVISNPGRVTDGRSSPRYSGNLRSVQFDEY